MPDEATHEQTEQQPSWGAAVQTSPNVAVELTRQREAIEAIAAHIGNDGSDIRERVQQILRV